MGPWSCSQPPHGGRAQTRAGPPEGQAGSAAARCRRTAHRRRTLLSVHGSGRHPASSSSSGCDSSGRRVTWRQAGPGRRPRSPAEALVRTALPGTRPWVCSEESSFVQNNVSLSGHHDDTRLLVNPCSMTPKNQKVSPG